MPIQPRARVLCVDNDEDSREMLSMLLGLSRLEAETVATAAQAHEAHKIPVIPAKAGIQFQRTRLRFTGSRLFAALRPG